MWCVSCRLSFSKERPTSVTKVKKKKHVTLRKNTAKLANTALVEDAAQAWTSLCAPPPSPEGAQPPKDSMCCAFLELRFLRLPLLGSRDPPRAEHVSFRTSARTQASSLGKLTAKSKIASFTTWRPLSSDAVSVTSCAGRSLLTCAPLCFNRLVKVPVLSQSGRSSLARERVVQSAANDLAQCGLESSRVFKSAHVLPFALLSQTNFSDFFTKRASRLQRRNPHRVTSLNWHFVQHRFSMPKPYSRA